MLLWILAVAFIAWAVLVIKYIQKLVYRDLEVFNEPDPNIEARFKPFERTDKKTWNMPEIYFCAVFLMPIRMVGAMLCLICLWISFKLISGNDSNAYLKAYSKRQRDSIKLISKFFARIILYCFGFYWIEKRTLRLKDFEDRSMLKSATAAAASKPNNKEKASQKITAPIIVSNHAQWLDIVYHASQGDVPSFLSKIELKNVPLVGPIARGYQTIFVNRVSESDRNQVSNAIKERGELIGRGENYPPIVIFPEGTTSNGKYLLSFKKGAFEHNFPVKVVCIEYPREHFDVALDFIGQLANIVLMSCQFKNNIRITEFDSDVDPTQLNFDHAQNSEEHWQTYARFIKKVMLKALPTMKDSESGYRDVKDYGNVLDKQIKQLEEAHKNSKKQKKND